MTDVQNYAAMEVGYTPNNGATPNQLGFYAGIFLREIM